MKKLIVLALVAGFLATAGIGCTKESSKASPKASEPGAASPKGSSKM